MPRRRSPIGLPPTSNPLDPPPRHAMPRGGDLYALFGTDEPERRPTPVPLTIPEVAARLRVSEKTVRRRIKDGVIRTIPIGGRLIRISPDEVLRLTVGDTPWEP
jgi:excisionase family DNA binding protein